MGLSADLGLGVGIDDAVEGVLHRLGVERRAVVEGHIVAQLEGVFRRIVVHRPLGGQAGHKDARLTLPDQRIRHVQRDVADA